MRAICRSAPNKVELHDIPVPEATPEHLVIKTTACGINAGDKAWLAGLFPEIPASAHDVCGACSAGIVTAIGAGVPAHYFGRKIATYRSLKSSDKCVGVWSEFARIHYLNTVLLSDELDEVDYAASLVSATTTCAFVNQITEVGHRAVLCTAGTSATGRALLGFCQARKIPAIAVVRKEASKASLWKLGAKYVLASADIDFDSELQKLVAALNVTAVFDGVGGALVGRVAKALPQNATSYCYGLLAGPEPLSLPFGLLLAKGLTLTSFSVLRPLVRDAAALKRLLADVQEVIGMPHFRTVVGQAFSFESAAEALAWHGAGKAVLRP